MTARDSAQSRASAAWWARETRFYYNNTDCDDPGCGGVGCGECDGCTEYRKRQNAAWESNYLAEQDERDRLYDLRIKGEIARRDKGEESRQALRDPEQVTEVTERDVRPRESSRLAAIYRQYRDIWDSRS